MDLTPTTLKDIVFEDDEMYEIVRNVVSNDNLYPSEKTGILLYGGYGTGKSTLARLLPSLIERTRVKDKRVDANYDFIDCTSSSGAKSVDRIRHISQFVSLNRSALRYFILDEFDNLSGSAQANLKGVMFGADTSAFILTTNNINQIDGGVRDRCWCVSFDSAPTERWLPVAKRLLKKLGVKNVPNDKLRAIIDAAPSKSARDIVSALRQLKVLRDQKERNAG